MITTSCRIAKRNISLTLNQTCLVPLHVKQMTTLTLNRSCWQRIAYIFWKGVPSIVNELDDTLQPMLNVELLLHIRFNHILLSLRLLLDSKLARQSRLVVFFILSEVKKQRFFKLIHCQ